MELSLNISDRYNVIIQLIFCGPYLALCSAARHIHNLMELASVIISVLQMRACLLILLIHSAACHTDNNHTEKEQSSSVVEENAVSNLNLSMGLSQVGQGVMSDKEHYDPLS